MTLEVVDTVFPVVVMSIANPMATCSSDDIGVPMKFWEGPDLENVLLRALEVL